MLSASMSTAYRSTGFALVYIGALLLVSACWFLSPVGPSWGAAVLISFGLLLLPFVWVKVEINEEGITQQTLRRHVARWNDILSWKREAHPESDGPDTITITTRSGSFALNHNCVYGRRLDFVESELRRRIAQPDGATDGSR